MKRKTRKYIVLANTERNFICTFYHFRIRKLGQFKIVVETAKKKKSKILVYISLQSL